jgi:hypothetical protein
MFYFSHRQDFGRYSKKHVLNGSHCARNNVYTETCPWVLEVKLRLESVLAGNYINHVLLALRAAVLNLGSGDKLQGVRELGLGGGGITYFALT